MKTTAFNLFFGSLLLAAPACAGTALSYANGDLFLCFRQTGNAEEYLVKLGPSTNFVNVSGTITVSGLGNIAQDLSDVFGEDWHTQGAVFWSVSGAAGGVPPSVPGANGEPARTIFATKAEAVYGTLATPWERASATAQSQPDSKMRSMGNAYAGSPANQSTDNSPVGSRQDTSKSNSYSSYQSAGSSFSYFPGGIEGTFANGAGGSALDLFRMTPNTGGGPGDYLGTFKITSAGVLTFTKQTAATFNAVITNFTRVGQQATVTGQGTPNAPYRIQRTTDLTAGWTTLTSPTINADAGGVIQYTDLLSPPGRAYYRIAAP